MHFRGNEVRDDVCLTSASNCATFNFFMIADQYGLPEQIDGVMGLTLGGRQSDGKLPSDYKVAPLPIDQFINAGHITGDKVFSTNFATGRSFIDFGPYKEANMSDPMGLVSFSVDQGYFWSAIPEGVRFGNIDGKEYLLENLPGIFSSSSVFTGVPKSLSRNFFKMLLQDIDTELEDGIFYTSCSSQFEEDIYFMFGGNWLQIKAKDMITDLSEAQDNSLCAVTFMPSENDYWWFGLNLYKDYYVIHNATKRTLGFVPTLDNIKDEIMDGARPLDSFPSYDWVLMLIKMGVGAVLSVTYWLLIKYLMEPTSNTGISFLNEASYKPTKKQAVTDQVAQLDTNTI